MVERRPTPEELLECIQAEEREARRGRLKVFLGYASRVGKSFRMLDEGRRRRERGEDVVVAAVQANPSPEVQDLLDKLEIIPPLRQGGVDCTALDTPAILRRAPQVCLVDELAYDNPPGCRHPHRWQEVEELLDHGISVITAVNLHHIEEMQNRVGSITGKRPEATVPELFLRSADEIELVDVALDELIDRSDPGKALDLQQLAELRELALLLAADVVDQQLQKYLDEHGIRQQWGMHERILVSITPWSNARRMLESGRRNGDRFQGELLAVYVEQPKLSEQDYATISTFLNLARALKAEVHTLRAADHTRAIINFARQQRITQIFVGHSLQRRGWLGRLRRTPLDKLISAASDMDVRVFPHEGP